ncbi:hypothetical protein PI172_2264 [Prevotella intermedia]|uniref:Uncharacterized protein n=1 Tax=Prevotella intermedia TaxID=28131 RepID=A0AAD1BMM4_PREIN|nr:hypothetical protein PI172_2264 [Prevotella intermedia]
MRIFAQRNNTGLPPICGTLQHRFRTMHQLKTNDNDMRKHLILLCTAAFLSSLHINRNQQNRTSHRIEPMQKPQPPFPMSHYRQSRHCAAVQTHATTSTPSTT